MLLNFCTILWDLYDIFDDFILFGDNMCITTGSALVLLKTSYHYYYSEDFKKMFEKLQQYCDENNQREQTIRDLQRKYFLEEIFILIVCLFTGTLLIIAICCHTLFDRTIPYRAKFPIEIHSSQRLTIVFLFQLIMCCYFIWTVVFIDSIGGQVLNQISLNFHVLCMDFQKIGEGLIANSRSDDRQAREAENSKLRQNLKELIQRHQKLISFGKHANAIYQPILMIQLVASVSMLCLTSFEATLTMDNIALFSKFAVYSIGSIVQILFWCYYGNRVFYMSSAIHEAMVQSNWISGDISFQKDLILVLMRARKPFRFDACGYFPITYETFITVLSRSYSLFTLCRTVSK
ncbi:putative odorant receptor 65c [Malaya genurostris]|uniref:putative odorant receptor 65c n=1 Tax=Malaya genurostris TaxID=325434 RepID=UPI0026F3A8F4|nr:putative odorant receptor 65c [Malaya genurostris]